MNTIIFDMDGTLIKSEEKYFYIWQELVNGKGFSLDVNFYQTLLGRPTATIKEHFIAHYGPEFPFDELFAEFLSRREIATATGDFEIMDGAKEFLQTCQQKKITCCLATSSHQAEATTILKKLQLFDYFSHTSFGDQVTVGKPNPEIFLNILTKAQVSATDCIVFEDSISGVRAAQGAKIPVYYLTNFMDLPLEYAPLISGTYHDFIAAQELLKN